MSVSIGDTSRHWRSLLILMVLASVPFVASEAAIDPNAEVVKIRKDCGTMDDCFTSVPAAMSWTWGTRNPTASTRLLVDIGPGEFPGTLTCHNAGYVTFRGSGRDSTTITGASIGTASAAADISDCFDLEFIDMTLSDADWPVLWSNGGSSSWTDVDIIGQDGGQFTLGWVDNVCPNTANPDIPVHYFFGTRIRVSGGHTKFGYPATAYWSQCSEAWFFGGEILTTLTSGGSASALAVNARGDFRAFGTAMRARTTNPAVAGQVIGVQVDDLGFGPHPDGPAVFHMHGGIINASSAAGGYSVATGVQVKGSDAYAHTPGTAYVIKSLYNTRVRSIDGGRADVPFLWQSGSEPPAAGLSAPLQSLDGQDLFVETDCDSSGNCAGAGTETHMMIYNSVQCGATNPWFDVVTGQCRQ